MSGPSDREERRLNTLKQNYTDAERRAWAKKGGQATPTKFTSNSSKRANEIRWARYRAAKEVKQKHANKK